MTPPRRMAIPWLDLANSWTARILAAGLVAAVLGAVAYATGSRINLLGIVTVDPASANVERVELAAEVGTDLAPLGTSEGRDLPDPPEVVP